MKRCRLMLTVTLCLVAAVVSGQDAKQPKKQAAKKKARPNPAMAKVEDVAYHSQKMWIDTERFVPLREELYAKSGQLLKRTTLSDVQKIEGRWFPMTIVFKDMLKQGDGTEFRMTKVQFDQEIPAYLFTKAALKQ